MGEWLRPALTPVTPQVSTPPNPLVLKEEPKIWSILFLAVMVISSRHTLLQAMVLSPEKPQAAVAISTRAKKSSTDRAEGKWRRMVAVRLAK